MQMNQISCMCSPLHWCLCLCLFVYMHETTEMQLYAPSTSTNARGNTHLKPESRLTRSYGSSFAVMHETRLAYKKYIRTLS